MVSPTILAAQCNASWNIKNPIMNIKIANPNMMNGCSGPMYSSKVPHDVKVGIMHNIVNIV